MSAPVIEYDAVDVLLKVIQGKQHLLIKSTNDVGSFFGGVSKSMLRN